MVYPPQGGYGTGPGGYYYALSNDVLQSHDAEATTQNTLYIKLKEITVQKLENSPKTLRIYFEIHGNASTWYGKIYKNGAAYGTERSGTSQTYVSYSEDLSFAVGDQIQLYVRQNTPGYTAYVRNFRVLGSLPIAPLIASEAFTAANTYP